ncbi:unnamed protein product [Staurois parvus]|uniref:Uncharacterized protein n=1 Tax=Staurois parvus TaxID=386267 RepID=A0ABN9CGQ7_9NEOB|nr:unnamed protein product [Staurois parvus]
MYTHTYMFIHADTCTDAYTDTHKTHTHPHEKKLQYFVVHSEIWVVHSRGRQRAQHTLLALFSLRSAIEQSDSSQCK